MYEQTPANTNSMPAFQNILERFEKQNAWQIEGLARIEDKLHSMLNRRVENKLSDKNDEPKILDFYQAMDRQLSMMVDNCNKIDALNFHLTMIL